MMKFSDRIQLMALKWDSTKEPHKTERFIDDVIHLINQLEGGEWLVFFLDHYLCRAKKNETYPTFMGGGIFDLNPPPIPLVAADPVEGEEEEEEEVERAQPSAHSADIVKGTHHRLHQEASRLRLIHRYKCRKAFWRSATRAPPKDVAQEGTAFGRDPSLHAIDSCEWAQVGLHS